MRVSKGGVWPFDVEQGYGHFQRDADGGVRHASSGIFARQYLGEYREFADDRIQKN